MLLWHTFLPFQLVVLDAAIATKAYVLAIPIGSLDAGERFRRDSGICYYQFIRAGFSSAQLFHEGSLYMSQIVRNDSLDNFETNRDQELGKAIAEAASAISTGIGKPRNHLQMDDLTDAEQSRREKISSTTLGER